MIISLPQTVVEKVVAALPDPVRRMLRMSRLYLAGGFIRSVVEGSKPSDIDIFGASKEELRRFAKLLAGEKHMRETRNAITLSLPDSPQVQFILRWLFDSPEKVVESFDFTIAQALVYFDPTSGTEGEWKGLASEFFFDDVANKQLRYAAPVREEDAAGSLFRVIKFVGRGYFILPLDLSRVVARIVKKVEEEKENALLIPVIRGSITDPEFDVERATFRIVEQARRVGGDSV